MVADQAAIEEVLALPTVTGNRSGLKAHHLKALTRLYRRKIPSRDIVTPDLAARIWDLSFEIGRQVGLLVDRRGQVEHVFVGDASGIFLPDFGRLRAGRGRFRGLRLIHTHLQAEALSRDDLADLVLLRLDLVAALWRREDRSPLTIEVAHLLPAGAASDLRTIGPVPLAKLDLDFAETIRSIEEEFARTASRTVETAEGRTRGILVHVSSLSKIEMETRVAEIKELSETAGMTIVDVFLQRRAAPDPKYVVGRGKLEDVLVSAMQLSADTLVFDPDLKPAQARAITDLTDIKVIDRTMLILDIFAQRAHTGAGKIQVELAQLKYALPRLVAKNTMMSRLTGGIGGRGPGETKLEINRRRARQRIADLEKQIDRLSRQRSLRRKRRQAKGVPVVALVGYTNAGKSTLLNTLTNATVLTEDRLFATLDPTSRRLRFPRNREIVLTDTVGFIDELPGDLAKAFRATLEEISEADFLLHLVDASDPNREKKREAVETILGQMGLTDKPRLTIYNKIDRLTDITERRLLERTADLAICSLDAESTRPLLALLLSTIQHKTPGVSR